MGLREMQDMEQLLVRGHGRHEIHPVSCCPECAAAQREYANRVSQPRTDVGVVPYDRRGWWDRAAPWLQIALVWGVMAWLVMYAPHQCREFSQWMSR